MEEGEGGLSRSDTPVVNYLTHTECVLSRGNSNSVCRILLRLLWQSECFTLCLHRDVIVTTVNKWDGICLTWSSVSAWFF